MFVEKWMTPNPFTLTAEDTVSFAAMEMSRRKFRHIPIVEQTILGKRLVGIVSKYDLARAFPDHLNPFSLEVDWDSVPKPLSAVMTKKVYTVTVDCPIEEAARMLRTHRIGALPVLRDGRVIGIITESDLFDAIISMTAAKSGGVRILVESDMATSPIPAVIDLSRQHKLEILSIMSFHENRVRGKDLSTFRFAKKLPAGFVQQICQLGFRVVSVGR
jgi:acetoin utilization protein AcuB